MEGAVQQRVSVQRMASAETVLSLVVPLLAALAAATALVGLYLGLVTWAQGIAHARGLLWDDRYFVAAIAAGFGIQAGLFVHLRRLMSARGRGSAAAGTAVGTGTSTVAMLACCAHHVTEALPVLGLSGAAVFLADYRVPLMIAGIAVNGGGVLFMLRLVHKERRQFKQGTCSATL